MPPKKKANAKPLAGAALVKEVNRRIRLARSLWDAHRNAACRGEREKVPQTLRVWLRYRSEKYFGDDRTPPGGKR